MGTNVTIDGTLYENIEVITVGGKTLYLAKGTGGSTGDSGTTPGGSGGASGLVTNGLLGYFDLRNATYNNDSTTTIAATQGEGQLYTWAANCVVEQGSRGIQFANTRKYEYSRAGNTTATEIGSSVTIVALTYGDVIQQGFNYENLGVGWQFMPQYNTNGGSTAYAEYRSGTSLNGDSKKDYNFCVYRVDGNNLKEIMDTTTTTYNGSEISDFSSWVTKPSVSVINANESGIYLTAVAIYDRALSDVEIEEVRAFMKTLEVA